MRSDNYFAPPKDKRLFVILGAFGSGKTEFSINLALAIKKQGRPCGLADLDLVNPYFRSREKEDLLENNGIELIAPEGALRNADLPSIPPTFRKMLFDPEMTGILDVGGDRVGARVLGQFTGEILEQKPAVWYVYNFSRYDNVTREEALHNLRLIEAQSGLAVTGLINNTHLLRETTPETILQGVKGARQLSDACGIPLICHCVTEALAGQTTDLEPLFLMNLHMNRPWEE